MGKVGLLLFVVSLFVTACEKDDLEFTKDGLPTNCAPNEIIYKTKYGYPIKVEEVDSVWGDANFNGNLVSNIYKNGYGRLVFDEDVRYVPRAFCSYNTSLQSIVLPIGIGHIWKGAFHGCTSLISVYCKAETPPYLDDSVFEDIIIQTLYVPQISVEEYKSSTWNRFFENIVGYDF